MPSDSTPLSPLSQSYYDENRQLYDAETTQAPLTSLKCPHTDTLERNQASNAVQCTACGVGWMDPDKILPI